MLHGGLARGSGLWAPGLPYHRGPLLLVPVGFRVWGLGFRV